MPGKSQVRNAFHRTSSWIQYSKSGEKCCHRTYFHGKPKEKKVMKMNTGVNWFVLASSGGGRSSPGPEMSMLHPPLQPALCCWTPQSLEGLKALKSPLSSSRQPCSQRITPRICPVSILTQQPPSAGAVTALSSPWFSHRRSPPNRGHPKPLSTRWHCSMSPLQPWWHPAHSQASCPCPQPQLPACHRGRGPFVAPPVGLHSMPVAREAF